MAIFSKGWQWFSKEKIALLAFSKRPTYLVQLQKISRSDQLRTHDVSDTKNPIFGVCGRKNLINPIFLSFVETQKVKTILWVPSPSLNKHSEMQISTLLLLLTNPYIFEFRTNRFRRSDEISKRTCNTSRFFREIEYMPTFLPPNRPST